MRLRVRVSTGCEEDFDEDPPMGRLLADPLEFSGERDDAEPRITRMGMGKVGEREFEEAAALTPFMSAIRVLGWGLTVYATARERWHQSPPLSSLHARCQHVPCLSPQHSQRSSKVSTGQ